MDFLFMSKGTKIKQNLGIYYLHISVTYYFALSLYEIFIRNRIC